MAGHGLIAQGSLIARVAHAGITHRIRPKLQQLILHVTKKCNFRCRHCFVDFNEIPKDLTLNEIEAVSKTVGRLIWLEIGGGEPFLRKDLVDVVSLFRFEELSVPTNGWFREETVAAVRRLAELFGNKVTIIVSVDGFRETHDEIRKHPGSFDRLIETFSELRRIPHIRVIFLSTLCERNAAELLELVKFTCSLGPDYHAVNILRGNPIDPTYKVDTEVVRRFWSQLEAFYRSSGYSQRRGNARVPLNYIRLRWTSAIRTLEERRQVVPCLGGTATLVVHPNGEVSPCETLPPVASIRERRLDEILDSSEWQKVVASIRAQECHCTHECNLKSSIFLNPLLYPSLAFGR
jgi:MoaA/NifB/PqqE/SkfB family radical SAM enzyme